MFKLLYFFITTKCGCSSVAHVHWASEFTASPPGPFHYDQWIHWTSNEIIWHTRTPSVIVFVYFKNKPLIVCKKSVSQCKSPFYWKYWLITLIMSIARSHCIVVPQPWQWLPIWLLNRCFMFSYGSQISNSCYSNWWSINKFFIVLFFCTSFDGHWFLKIKLSNVIPTLEHLGHNHKIFFMAIYVT